MKNNIKEDNFSEENTMRSYDVLKEDNTSNNIIKPFFIYLGIGLTIMAGIYCFYQNCDKEEFQEEKIEIITSKLPKDSLSIEIKRDTTIIFKQYLY